MMKNAVIQSLISRLENDKARHEQQFAGQPQHDSCLVKLTEKVRDLEAELSSNCDTESNEKMDMAPVTGAPTNNAGKEGEITAKGDEFEKVDQLQAVAVELEQNNHEQAAGQVKTQMRDMVAKQLNELDGFDR